MELTSSGTDRPVDACRGPADELELRPPARVPADVSTSASWPTAARRPWRVLVAAALLLLVSVPAARWALAELRVREVEAGAWRLVVSGPTHVPDGAPANVGSSP